MFEGKSCSYGRSFTTTFNFETALSAFGGCYNVRIYLFNCINVAVTGEQHVRKILNLSRVLERESYKTFKLKNASCKETPPLLQSPKHNQSRTSRTTWESD